MDVCKSVCVGVCVLSPLVACVWVWVCCDFYVRCACALEVLRAWM